MVTYFGMSDSIGNVSYYDSTGRSEMGLTKPYSEKTAEEIDKEVKRLIDQAHATATRVLEAHREGFEQLAALLLEREVIFSEDVERILGPRPGGVNPNAVIDGSQTLAVEDSPVEQKPVAEETSPTDSTDAPEPESPAVPASQATVEPEKEQSEESELEPRARRKAAPRQETGETDPVVEEDNSSQPTLF